MYERDYLLNEARKFAQLLAKLMGLKTEGTSAEYLHEFDSVLQDEYDIELEQLLGLTETAFIARLQEANYSAEKLNALSQMLYVFAEPFAATDEVILILKKVLAIFNLLEVQHHAASFENITKQKNIYLFLSSVYE